MAASSCALSFRINTTAMFLNHDPLPFTAIRFSYWISFILLSVVRSNYVAGLSKLVINVVLDVYTLYVTDCAMSISVN